MDLVLVVIVAAFASALTLVSGFGLGTILLTFVPLWIYEHNL